MRALDTATAAFDVGVEPAQPFAAGRQRSNDATALVAWVGSPRSVSQSRVAGAARYVQPRRDGLQQGSGRLAPWHLGAGDAWAFGGIEHQHHAPRTAEPGRFGDEAFADRGLALELAQTQRGARQAGFARWATRRAVAPGMAFSPSGGRAGGTLSSGHLPLLIDRLAGQPCGLIIR